MWVYQNHTRKIRSVSLLNTQDQGMMQHPHLDYTKGGPPNTGYGSTHRPVIRPSGTCVMDGQVMTLYPGL
jgi:hypothetical protein